MIGLTTRILLRDYRSPSSRLAWFIVIILLPLVGGVVYFLFGETRLGKAAARRNALIFDNMKTMSADTFGDLSIVLKSVDPLYQPAFRYAASMNGLHTLGGNRAELMADARAARERLIADIDAATNHVHLLYYIWLDDETGRATARALMRAVSRGVVCRAMVDGLGSRGIIRSPLWREMRDAGVKVSVTLPIDNFILAILRSRLDLRNHRKLIIIDGSITHCGSQNCADPEFRIKARYAPWVDIMLRIEGPVAAQNQALFASDWLQVNDDELADFPFITKELGDGFPGQILADGPTVRLGATAQLFATMINVARDELTISTPYFVPDATVLDAICAAALRGVSVTMIFPLRNDSWIVAAASRSFYWKLLRSGVNIYEFIPGLIHAKTLTIDGQVTFLGTSNIDIRSFDLNYENDVLLQDRAISVAVRARQSEYIEQSMRVTLEDVESWPLHHRIWNNVVATMGPVL